MNVSDCGIEYRLLYATCRNVLELKRNCEQLRQLVDHCVDEDLIPVEMVLVPIWYDHAMDIQRYFMGHCGAETNQYYNRNPKFWYIAGTKGWYNKVVLLRNK